MSYLSGQTKRVSVYGKKAPTRVINKQTTFTALLPNDENDPFGFFSSSSNSTTNHQQKQQHHPNRQDQPAKPHTTYSKLQIKSSKSIRHTKNTMIVSDSEEEFSLESDQSTNNATEYETAESSLSFDTQSSADISASSSVNELELALANTPKPTSKNHTPPTAQSRRRTQVLRELSPDGVQIITTPKPKKVGPASTSRPTKQKGKSSLLGSAVDRSDTSNNAPITPPYRRKTTSTIRSNSTLKDELDQESGNHGVDTQSRENGKAGNNARPSRRAAKAAILAIQDYDFTDRDVTPRRPVPTKSYFAEKAKQLAEEQSEEKGTSPKQESITIVVEIPALDPIPDSGKLQKQKSRMRKPGKGDKHAEEESVDGENHCDQRRQADAQTVDLVQAMERMSVKPGAAETNGHDALETSARGITGLLSTVSQTAPIPFSRLIRQLRCNRPIADKISSVPKGEPQRRLEKIGEASFSEVFKIFGRAASKAINDEGCSGLESSMILKIIPISVERNPSWQAGAMEVEEEEEQQQELPETSAAADVEREVQIMQLLSGSSSALTSHSEVSAFVQLQKAYVVEGDYPASLLRAWDRWDLERRDHPDRSKQCINVRPSAFNQVGDASEGATGAPKQLFAILVMSDGGMDLESFPITSWTQAASVWSQVAAGLANAEKKLHFEHRDLHWGNILVQPQQQQHAPQEVGVQGRSKNKSKYESDDNTTSSSSSSLRFSNPFESGTRASIIDFTLSRATLNDEGQKESSRVVAYAFDDESIFEGQGDTQFEVYRQMRQIVQDDDWTAFHPETNLVWLKYLADKLVLEKCRLLELPVPKSKSGKSKSKSNAAEEEKKKNALAVATEQDVEAKRWLFDVQGVLDIAVQEILSRCGTERVKKTVRNKTRRPPSSLSSSVLDMEADQPKLRSAADLVDWLIQNES